MSTRSFARAAGLLTAVCLLLGNPSSGRAQSVNLGLGAGTLIPIDDYGSVDKVGWQGMVLATFGIPSTPLAIRLDGTYGQTSHQESVPGHSRVWGGTANLQASFGRSESRIRPYVFAGGGIYDVKVEVTGIGEASETKAAFDGGLGISAQLGASGNQAFFVEGRFVSVRNSGSPTNFFPITAGFTFALR